MLKGLDPAVSRLVYRRQFLLAPREVPVLSGWQRVALANNLVVHAHPDLPLTRTDPGKATLLLLGFMVDPDRPEDANADILRRLVAEGVDEKSIFSRADRMGGRWVLIYHDSDATVLFTDPAGFRQVFFATDSTGRYCASQPGLLSEVLAIAPDSEFAREFVSEYERRNAEYFFPGTLSGFSRVQSLLPNHFLDVRSGIARRFWPHSPIPALSLKDGVEASADILRRQMLAISRRYPLCIGLTAGLDTRVVLAACRDIASSAEYYTLLFWKRSARHVDSTIASQLANRLGLKHRLIQCPSALDTDAACIYKKNVAFAHDRTWGGIVMGHLNGFPEGALSVKGSAGEIARVFYEDARDRSAEGLLDLHRMPHTLQALSETRQWQAEAEEVEKSLGIDLFDLYYWEIRMGKWQAMSGAEHDIACDYFSPFNCRDLLATMLAVGKPHRIGPDYGLFTDIARYLWPETMLEAINPAPFWEKVRGRIRRRVSCVPGYWRLRDAHRRRFPG
jgi:hypothetical protein